MRIYLASTIFFSFFSIYSFSQGQRAYGEFSNKATQKLEEKILKSARREFDYGNYKAAAEKYAELLKLDSLNPMYNFEQAQTLYNNYRQPQSIPFYEKAINYSKDTLGEACYFLASAYHLAGNFEQAQKYYKRYAAILQIYGTDLTEEEEIELKNDVNHKIEMCDNGKTLIQIPPADQFTLNGKSSSFQIIDVGEDVNSEYDDYGAVLSTNDSVMYFTSRREGTTGNRVDWDDKFFEDIHISTLGRKGWDKSVGIGAPINTSKHEAIISISSDANTIYFYRGEKQGTFYYSNRVGNTWAKPEVLYDKADMNTQSWETSFFGFTVAGSDLYVVSDREGGQGGRDIYVSKKQSDGSWGPLTNIGATINTKYDEDAPYITSDGKTMYFSSVGHNSMGGFDIFKSEKQGDNWSQPVNLGIPFNTPGNDIYFIVANKSDRAFFSSSSHASDGTKDMDIYMIDLCDDIPETILAGTVLDITNGSVSVAEKESGRKIGDFNIENGNYSMRLRHGMDYRFTWNLPSASTTPISADISVPRLCKVYDLYQQLELEQGKQNVVAKNAFFNIKKEAGANNFSDFLAKMDKSSIPLYSEVTMPITVLLAKTDTTKITTAVTPTVTATTTTTVTTASGNTVTAAATPTVVAATTTVAITSATPTTTVTSGTTTVSSYTTTTAATTTVTGTTITTISVNNILFDYDQSNMRQEFISELDKVADFLKNANKKATIEVEGHTDSKGSDEYNLALSKRRANAVTSYLVSKGISKGRIKAIGYGESKPVAPNENPDGSDNPDGRAKNRRTEVVVIQR